MTNEEREDVSIPQAVSTIAILVSTSQMTALYFCFNTASGKHYCNRRRHLQHRERYESPVSIPQAVSTIAIKSAVNSNYTAKGSFNTASGKHYCNDKEGGKYVYAQTVSIPQAVSTIAILVVHH